MSNIMTRWGKKVNKTNIHKEYPRSRMVRDSYLNLNGEWEFQIDNEKCGEFKGYYHKEHLEGRIIVPFCPESELSGVNNKDFMNPIIIIDMKLHLI